MPAASAHPAVPSQVPGMPGASVVSSQTDSSGLSEGCAAVNASQHSSKQVSPEHAHNGETVWQPFTELAPHSHVSPSVSPWGTAEASPGPSRAASASVTAMSDGASENVMPIRADSKAGSSRARPSDEAEANPDLYGLRRSVSV